MSYRQSRGGKPGKGHRSWRTRSSLKRIVATLIYGTRLSLPRSVYDDFPFITVKS